MFIPYEKAIIIDQADFQINLSRIAITNINHFSRQGQIDCVFYHIQALMGTIGNLADLISHDEVKNEFNINFDRLLIIKNKDVRNTFMHYDERLFKFFKIPNSNYIDRNIGPIKFIQCSNGVFMRHYDNYSRVITSVDRQMNQISLDLNKIGKDLEYLVSILT